MNDLISRQAAIDKLKSIIADREYTSITDEAKEKIARKFFADIPSAQRWIPCSERLPKKDGYYLTTTCYRQVYEDFWSEDHFDRTEAVIAWMPLPEPYKGEE